MALHKVLPFTVPPRARARHRRPARPASIIPLHYHDWHTLPARASAPFAIAVVLLWATITILGLFALWANREWIGVTPLWSRWPIW